MNYVAGVAVIIGGVALIIGIKGTQSSVWDTFTRNVINPSISSFNFKPGPVVGGGASADFSYTPPSNSTPAPNGKYQQLAYKDAVANGINPAEFVAQIQQESGFNPNVVSPAGAQGIAQFMPSTSASVGVNPLDPVAALSAAAKLMANYVRQYGSEAAALASYNAGPAAYQSAVGKGGSNWMSYLPAETQNYINEITKNSSPVV